VDFTVDKKTLMPMLARAASAAAKKSPVPIMKCVLIEADKPALKLRATDSFVGVEMVGEAAVKTAGSAAVDASKAAAIVKGLPAGQVRVRLVKEAVEFSSAKSKSKLASLEAADFPAFPALNRDKAKMASITGQQLAGCVARGAYAAGQDESRAHLNGAMMVFEQDTLRIASSDGQRLAVGQSSLANYCERLQFFLPIRGLSEVKSLCESASGAVVECTTSGEYAFFCGPDETLIVKLGDQAFCPWESILKLNAKLKRSVVVQRESFVEALKRVRVFADGDGELVRIDFSEGSVRIYSATELGESDDVLDCNADFGLEIGVGASNAIEAASAITEDDLTIKMGGPLDQMVMECERGVHVVMPMRR
jgi:DNA polymerase-3 subunit beta